MIEMRKLCAADMFPMLGLLSRIGIKEIGQCFDTSIIKDVMKRLQDGQDVAEAAGIQVMTEIADVVISHLAVCEKELLALLASVTGKTAEELRNLEISEFIELIIAFIRKEEFMDFFRAVSSALQ